MVFFLLIPAPAAFARQAEAQAWYYAVTGGGQLVAYTPDGQTNTLIESGVMAPAASWRLDDGSSVAVLTVNALRQLYHLTPGAALLLEHDLAQDVLAGLTNRLPFAHTSGPYLALAGSAPEAPAQAMLIDVSAGNVVPLTGQVYNGADVLRFSADGQVLRYFSRAADAAAWTLWERTLATGQERAVYTLENALPAVSTDRYGDAWLIRASAETTLTDTLVRADGSADVLAEAAPDAAPVRLIVGDALAAYAWPCAGGCALELAPLDGGGVEDYELPPLAQAPQILARPDEASLLIESGGAFWQLERDGPPWQIGCSDPEVVTTTWQRLLSPDGRYLLTVDDPDVPTRYRVWDGVAREYVVQGDAAEAQISVYYVTGGVLVRRLFTEETWLHRYADGVTVGLPADPRRTYYEALPDGALLLWQSGPGGALTAPGLYHFDPAADAYTPILPDAWPLVVRVAR